MSKPNYLLGLIHNANGELPPQLVGMKFITHVKDGRGFDAPFAWAVYISHDPCHDDEDRGFVDDRNTVIAFHRTRGEFRIIGRELPLKLATDLIHGVGTYAPGSY